MRRSTRKAIKAAGGRDPSRTRRRISPPTLPPSQKKTAAPPSTTFNSFFIQQTQNAAYYKYLINKTKHTSVPTLVDSRKVRRGNKNGRMSTPVSEDTLSQTSSTTTTFSNYKTQDHNSIYTTTSYKSLRSRAKLIPIGLYVAEKRGDPGHVIDAARELLLRRTRRSPGSW
jgi:hypothetical protein